MEKQTLENPNTAEEFHQDHLDKNPTGYSHQPQSSLESAKQTAEEEKRKIRITALRQTVYPDLMEQYENPIEHTCDVQVGQQWISVNGQQPDGLCPSAWSSMQPFVEALARGEGNFYDGWMKEPQSAMISCNDGFRPVSFYIETISEK